MGGHNQHHNSHPTHNSTLQTQKSHIILPSTNSHDDKQYILAGIEAQVALLSVNIMNQLPNEAFINYDPIFPYSTLPYSTHTPSQIASQPISPPFPSLILSPPQFNPLFGVGPKCKFPVIPNDVLTLIKAYTRHLAVTPYSPALAPIILKDAYSTSEDGNNSAVCDDEVGLAPQDGKSHFEHLSPNANNPLTPPSIPLALHNQTPTPLTRYQPCR